MVEHILKQQQPLCIALLEICKTELMSSDVEIAAMETFLDVVHPFVQINESVEVLHYQ